jgi:hypothetical protein
MMSGSSLYPLPIVGVKGYLGPPDPQNSSALALLILQDAHGGQVTLPLAGKAADIMIEALKAGLTPAQV